MRFLALFACVGLVSIALVAAKSNEKSGQEEAPAKAIQSPTNRIRGITSSKTNARSMADDLDDPELQQVKQEYEGEVKGRPATRRPLPAFQPSTRNPLEPPSDVRKKFNVLLRTASGFNDKEGIAVSSGRTAVN